MRAELDIFAHAAKNNSEIKVEQGGGLFIPKSLPKPSFYLASIDKVNLTPEITANKVVRAYAVIEEYPMKLLYALGYTKAGEKNTVQDGEDYYLVNDERKLKTVAAMHGALYNIIIEAIEGPKKYCARIMGDFVAYYRVSTDRQGQSGLGLDAQRAAVAAFATGWGELTAEFTEVESGRRNDRPELRRALDLCRQRRATLVIAKLDRLARSVSFIANLMDSGVEFVAVDMPQANRLTLHILAAVAEHEREMISARTKAALAAARARGVRLGNPSPDLERARERASANASRFRGTVAPLVRRLRGEGLSLRQVAAELNARGIRTARGRRWQGATVLGVLNAIPSRP